MILFFDVGQKGAISFWQKEKLLKVVQFQLKSSQTSSIKNKLMQFYQILEKEFTKTTKITDIGCFQPFGTNRKTIINLAMMSTIPIIFFAKANFHFINEWTTWKGITKNKIIPLRKTKKAITVKWAENKFNITKLNDDQADAILGGFFLSQKLKKE